MYIDWLVRYDGREMSRNPYFRCSGQIELNDITRFNLKMCNIDANIYVRVTSKILEHEFYNDNHTYILEIYNQYKLLRKLTFHNHDDIISRLRNTNRCNINTANIIECIGSESLNDIKKLIQQVIRKTNKLLKALR